MTRCSRLVLARTARLILIQMVLMVMQPTCLTLSERLLVEHRSLIPRLRLQAWSECLMIARLGADKFVLAW